MKMEKTPNLGAIVAIGLPLGESAHQLTVVMTHDLYHVNDVMYFLFHFRPSVLKRELLWEEPV